MERVLDTYVPEQEREAVKKIMFGLNQVCASKIDFFPFVHFAIWPCSFCFTMLRST